MRTYANKSQKVTLNVFFSCTKGDDNMNSGCFFEDNATLSSPGVCLHINLSYLFRSTSANYNPSSWNKQGRTQNNFLRKNYPLSGILLYYPKSRDLAINYFSS